MTISGIKYKFPSSCRHWHSATMLVSRIMVVLRLRSVSVNGLWPATFRDLFITAAGPQAGYSSLDSLRAVYASGNLTGINTDPLTTMHGYSSGAQAIGWATELHPTYAPELKIAGAAFGGLVPNLSALIEMREFSSCYSCWNAAKSTQHLI